MRNDFSYCLVLFITLTFPVSTQSLALPEVIFEVAGPPSGWDVRLFNGLGPGWYSLGYLKDRPEFPLDVTVSGRGCFFLPRGYSPPVREDLKSLLDHLLKSQSPKVGAFSLYDLSLPVSDLGPRIWTTPGGGREVLHGVMTATGGTGPGAARWRFRLEAWIKVPVVQTNISAGGTFGPRDLSWTWVKADGLLGRAPEEGEIPPLAMALVPLSPGTPLRTTSFRPVYAVTRNQRVRVVFLSKGLKVEVDARALGDGNPRDEVEVLTPEGRRFHGWVTDQGTVEVRLP